MQATVLARVADRACVPACWGGERLVQFGSGILRGRLVGDHSPQLAMTCLVPNLRRRSCHPLLLFPC